MSCAAVNWFACWVCLAMGIGFGMFLSALFASGK